MGNGLKAIFKLESKFESVYKSISAKYDSFSDNSGDYNNIMCQYLVFPGSADMRYPKTTKYISPYMNGIKLMAN